METLNTKKKGQKKDKAGVLKERVSTLTTSLRELWAEERENGQSTFCPREEGSEKRITVGTHARFE